MHNIRLNQESIIKNMLKRIVIAAKVQGKLKSSIFRVFDPSIEGVKHSSAVPLSVLNTRQHNYSTRRAHYRKQGKSRFGRQVDIPLGLVSTRGRCIELRKVFQLWPSIERA